MSENDAAHITRLEITDFRGLSQLTVDRPGRFCLAKGGTGAGKTSVLDAIITLVRGAGIECIRKGADKAEIVAHIGENARARRVLTGKGNGKLDYKMRIAGEEERWAAMPSPQAMVTEALGACDWRPLDFFGAQDGKARKAAILSLVDVECTEEDWKCWGVDAEDIEALHELGGKLHPLELVGAVEKTIYDRRAAANRDTKAAQKAADAAQVEGLQSPRTTEEIADAQAQIQQKQKLLSERREQALANARAIAGHEATAKAARERAAELDEEAGIALLRSNNISQAAAEHETAAEQLADQADAIEVPDTAAIEAEIDRLRMQLADALKQGEAKHAKMREAQQAEADAKRCHQSAAAHSEMAQQHTLTAVQKRREAGIAEDAAKELAGSGSPEALDAKLSELAKQERALAAEMAWDVKRAALLDANAAAAALDATLTAIREHALPTLLQRAQMPIEGLGVNERDITYNGVDGSQLSDGEKMILAVKIGQARAGDGGVVCLDGLEKLDPSMREKLVEMTRNDKRRYFATLVADGPLEIVDADEAAMEANCPEPIF